MSILSPTSNDALQRLPGDVRLARAPARGSAMQVPAAMKLSQWSGRSLDIMAAEGFRQWKTPHEFVRVRNGVAQLLSFQGKKKDIHVWVNALPLAMPDFWLSMGWRRAVGRAPAEEGLLNVEGDASDIPRIQDGLRDALRSEAFPKLNGMDTLISLHDAIEERSALAAWPKAFCMFQLGEVEAGKMHLQNVMQGPASHLAHPVAKEYLAADPEKVEAMVAAQVMETIEKNRLRGCMG